MKTHKRKMIAPIVVSFVMVLYYAVYFGILITLVEGIYKWLLGIIPIILSALMIGVCIEESVKILEEFIGE